MQILYFENHIDFIPYIENKYPMCLKSKAYYDKQNCSEIKVSGLENIKTTVKFNMFCSVLNTKPVSPTKLICLFKLISPS